MKRICTLLLAASMLLGVATGASAIDFKAKGQWIMSFDYGQNGGFTGGHGMTGYNQANKQYKNEDEFEARQRVRLQLDAVASESLSGTVFFEIGDQMWGKASQGGALGADGNSVVEVKNAYIDWMVPQTDLKVRMGIQGVALPSFTTGSNVFNDDVAGVVASYQFNENVGLTALWARPFNDNYNGWNKNGNTSYAQNYMDNMDVFALLVPLSFDGVKVTPWGMMTAIGPNTFRSGRDDNFGNNINAPGMKFVQAGMLPVGGAMHKDGSPVDKRLTSYGTGWWAGLTGEVTMWDPFRFAWDFNYGSVNYDESRMNRSGWLASLLFEYKLDWGIPGLYGWYGSGDDGNVKNGSERMPSIVPMGNFTSFMGDGNYGWMWVDNSLEYAGTWGLGLQVRDMSFLEDLKHTFRVAYWAGTNSTSMVKYMDTAYAWNYGWGSNASPYLTTEDSLLEFNLVNSYQMYENFDVNLELGYIANFMDNDTWKKAGSRNSSFQKQDAWKAQLIFAYSF